MSREQTHLTVFWALAGLTALGVTLRFASLGVQSYHHDEVITAARVIPGSFTSMLGQVRDSESNPPLYYVLAWAWAKTFGTGEIGLRSLSALFGAATVPVAYLFGRELASERTGLFVAGIAAVNPMLIWYSQEARSYALLVFFGTLALVFFVRALRSSRGSDLALWALFSALALCSHYFAAFAIAIEAAWLLAALRGDWRAALPALAAVLLVALGLLPLALSQVNPTHIGWIDHSALSSRVFQTGVSFLAGETGHVIAEPPRERYAVVPAAFLALAALPVILRGTAPERRRAALSLSVGAGVVLLASGIALAGKDYIVERNLLPALMPLAGGVAIGFSLAGARRFGLVCAVLLCGFWLVFDVYVTRTPNLQRPDFRDLTEHLGPPSRPRAIVTWKLAADPIRFYLEGRSERVYGGDVPLREIDVVSKPIVARRPPGLPPGFHPVERVRLERLTLTRYVTARQQKVPFRVLRNARTGFGVDAVVADGLPAGAWRTW